MSSNLGKSRISNVKEILRKVSFQLKGARNIGSVTGSVAETENWKSIEDVSDNSHSDDKADQKSKKASKFLKRNKEDVSEKKPTEDDSTNKTTGKAAVNRNVIEKEKQSYEQKTPQSKADTKFKDLSDFDSDLISISKSEETDSSLKEIRAKKNKFMKKTDVANKSGTQNIQTSKSNKSDFSQYKQNIKNNTKLTIREIKTNNWMKINSNNILDSQGNAGGYKSEVSNNKQHTINNDNNNNDEDLDNDEDFDNDDGIEENVVNEDLDDKSIAESQSTFDDEIFGNLQELNDLSEIGTIYNKKEDTQTRQEHLEVVTDVFKRGLDQGRNVKNKEKDNRITKEEKDDNKEPDDKDNQKNGNDLFHSKNLEISKFRVVKSLFHANSSNARAAPKSGKELREKKEIRKDDSIEEYVASNSIQDDSIASYYNKDTDDGTIKSEESQPSKSSRSPSHSSSSKSQSSKLSRSVRSRSSTSYSEDSYTTSSPTSQKLKVKMVDSGVQTGLDLCHSHWLLDEQPQVQKFNTGERRFLTSQEGLDTLKDLTNYVPAMACLNSIIRQQVSLLAAFVTIQKRLHRQVIESTKQKAPYKYTTLQDVDKAVRMHKKKSQADA